MISASHNPYQDNGIKFFSNDGLKLPDEIEARIEELIVSNEIAHLRPTADAIGKAFRIDDAEGRYIEFVKRSLPKDLDFQGIKLVVDCANGAAYKVAPTVLRELGAKVDVDREQAGWHEHQRRLRRCPSRRCCSEPSRNTAHISGLRLDGDADRAIFVCEQGNVIDGDHIMAALGLDLQRQRPARQTDGRRNRHEQFWLGAGAQSGGHSRCCAQPSVTATYWSGCWQTGTTSAVSNPGISSFWTTIRPATG